MRDSREQHIVVGISDSRASLTALHWAAAEARLRGASLHVVRAWDSVRHAAPYAAVGQLPTGDEQEAEVRAGLAADMQAEFGPATPGGVTTELAEGAPERILVAQSARADLLRACLAHAGCPVVIVGSADETQAPASRERAIAAIG